MAEFVQPINRENDIKEVLDGYERAIQNDDWLATALQKDGIQNSWDAMNPATAEEWECTIALVNAVGGNPALLTISDRGTFGLTGGIPASTADLTKYINRNSPAERLSYFASSKYSNKGENALGSRGRGKLVFIGASQQSRIYFDTLRSSDGKYVFGVAYLDPKTKMILVNPMPDGEGDRERNRVFKGKLRRIAHVGTRVIIPEPKIDLVATISDGRLAQIIQQSWWEILTKYGATITISTPAETAQVKPPAFLPIGMAQPYENVAIDSGSDFKIKKIEFKQLKGDAFPDDFRGVAIQRNGMTVERLNVGELNSDLSNKALFGTVEFEGDLNKKMLEVEDVEHCGFRWNRWPANRVKLKIRENLLQYAREQGLIHDEQQASKEQREAELEVEKSLNQLAKNLGLRGTGLFGGKHEKGKKPPQPTEQIFLTIPDFETPDATRKVETGQKVTGAYAVPVSNHEDGIKVRVRTWIYREDKGAQVSGLVEQDDFELDNTTSKQVGWHKVDVDGRFSKGQYHLRAKLVALESKTLPDGQMISKGDILGNEITKVFWVDEEPPADKGLFQVRRKDIKDDKSKFVWWEEAGDITIIYWNGFHPQAAKVADDASLLSDMLRKEGTTVIWSICLAVAQAGDGAAKKQLMKAAAELGGQPFETQIKWVLARRSEELWK